MPATESLSAVKERENARDRALMARSASGEREALEELFKAYNERIYHSCLHVCRSPDDAIDATQEAFLNVFKRMREQNADISSFRDYIFTSSRNASLKIIAKRSRSVPTEEVPENAEDRVIDAIEDPERSLLIEDQQEIVRSASGRISKRQLDALKMYELDGMDYKDIGQQLELEPNAVAQLISRARQKLRTEVRYSGAAQHTSTEICTRAMALMSKKVDGTLTKRQAIWLDPHIESCDICKTNLNVMEEVGTSYRSLLPPSALIFERVFRDDALAQLYPRLTDSGTTSTSTAAQGTGIFTFSRKIAASILILGGVALIGATSSSPGVPDPDTYHAITSDASDVQNSLYAGLVSPQSVGAGAGLVADGTVGEEGASADNGQTAAVPSWPGVADAQPVPGNLVSVIDPTSAGAGAVVGVELQSGSGGDEGDAEILSNGATASSASSGETTRRRRGTGSGSEDNPFYGFQGGAAVTFINSGSSSSRRRGSGSTRSGRSTRSSRSGSRRGSSSGSGSGRSHTNPGSSSGGNLAAPSIGGPGPGTSSPIGGGSSGSTSESGGGTPRSGDSGEGSGDSSRTDTDSGSRDGSSGSGDSGSGGRDDDNGSRR